jgi:hypothetical protein
VIDRTALCLQMQLPVVEICSLIPSRIERDYTVVIYKFQPGFMPIDAIVHKIELTRVYRGNIGMHGLYRHHLTVPDKIFHGAR